MPSHADIYVFVQSRIRRRRRRRNKPEEKTKKWKTGIDDEIGFAII